jgi:hypothetical protein
MADITTLTLINGEEKILMNFDFSNHKTIKQGAVITSIVEIVAVPAVGVLIESPVIDATGKIVQAQFTPSATGTYALCCKVNTTTLSKPKLSGILQVVEC